MTLDFHHRDEQKIVYKRSAMGCANQMPLFAGVGLIIFGLFFVRILMPSPAEPFIISAIWAIPGVALGMGMLCFMVGAFMLPAQYRNIPAEIIFDHQRAVVVVRMESFKQEGIIPYQQIDNFFVHRENNSSQERNDYTYHVVMKKKDGGEWFIMQTIDGHAAQANVNLLQGKVLSGGHSQEAVNASTSPRISLKEGADQSIISWKNNFNAAFFFVLLFTIMFGVAAFFIVQSVGVLGFAFALAAIGLAYLSVRMFHKHTRQYAVSIKTDAIDYFEFSVFTGKQSRAVTLPLEAVERVAYTFSPTLKGRNRLWLMKKEDVQRLETLDGTPEKFIQDLLGKHQPLTLDVLALNPVECLQLEAWLEQKIRASKPEREAF